MLETSYRAPRAEPRTIVIETEQLDDRLHIVLTANAHAHPPGVRQDVVTLRTPCGYQLIADRNRKWKIGKPASMQMAELSSSHAEFEAAEPMRSGNDIVPRRQFAGDSRGE